MIQIHALCPGVSPLAFPPHEGQRRAFNAAGFPHCLHLPIVVAIGGT